jgi:hypothetical protein
MAKVIKKAKKVKRSMHWAKLYAQNVQRDPRRLTLDWLRSNWI